MYSCKSVLIETQKISKTSLNGDIVKALTLTVQIKSYLQETKKVLVYRFRPDRTTLLESFQVLSFT